LRIIKSGANELNRAVVPVCQQAMDTTLHNN
jgi:hypothetical protein